MKKKSTYRLALAGMLTAVMFIIGYVESLLSDTLKKSWKSARKFIGKTVKPEKESKYKQMSQQYRSQLMQNMQK